MPPKPKLVAFRLLAFLLACGLPALSSAQQPVESVGARALGMGGAFVAVANDASATHWNPAGLVTAGPAGVTIEWADFRTGNQTGDPVVGLGRRHAYFSSLGTLPVGLSLTRTSDARITDVTGARARATTLATTQYGVSLLQSVVKGLVIGANLKLVRGTVSEAVGSGLSADALLGGDDDRLTMTSHRSTSFDCDLSAMADFDKVRVGVLWKNLRQPGFTNVEGIATHLKRAARAGVSVLPTSGLTLALDMDLDTVDLWDGPRRMLAVGGEQRLTTRLVVRAGARWNRAAEVRGPVYTAGASINLKKSLWFDTHATYGDISRDRGVGAALRAGF